MSGIAYSTPWHTTFILRIFCLDNVKPASKRLDIKVHNRLDSDKWEAIVFRVTSSWLTGGPLWSLDGAGWTPYDFQEGQKSFTYTTTLSGCNIKFTPSTRTGVVILFNYSRTRSGNNLRTSLGHVFRRFSQNCEKRLLVSSCLSVRPSLRIEQLGSHWTDFHEIWYLSIFRKLPRKFTLTRITGTLHGYQYTFFLP